MKGGERNFARICDIGEVRNMGKVRSVMKIGISGKLGNKGSMRKMRTIRKIDHLTLYFDPRLLQIRKFGDPPPLFCT